MNINNSHADEINLLKIVRQLCTRQIRHPMSIEQIKVWLKQFNQGPEKILALLILRYMIYRTTKQLDSLFTQALKSAATNFIPLDVIKEDTNWRDVLNGTVGRMAFSFGPLRHTDSRPGKSGEIVSRRLKFCDLSAQFKLAYPDQVTDLNNNERYLLIDDGAFTGHQLMVFLKSSKLFLSKANQIGVVVGLIHEYAKNELSNTYPSIPLFYGEQITPQECFVAMAEYWLEDGIWPYSEITPLEQYMSIVKRAKFSDRLPLGYGDLGCMVAYEHGVPDNSLQLLWDRSKKWSPLFPR